MEDGPAILEKSSGARLHASSVLTTFLDVSVSRIVRHLRRLVRLLTWLGYLDAQRSRPLPAASLTPFPDVQASQADLRIEFAFQFDTPHGCGRRETVGSIGSHGPSLLHDPGEDHTFETTPNLPLPFLHQSER